MKTLKKVIACLMTAAIVFSMASCGALDKLKEKQAFYDEEKDQVTWKGNTYVRVEGDVADKILEYSYIDYSNQVNVTTRDVPVLLSETYGCTFRKNSSEILLSSAFNSFYDPIERNMHFYTALEDSVFVREDKAEEINGELEDIRMDHLSVRNGEMIRLTEELEGRLKARLNEQVFVQEDEIDWDKITEYAELYRCDDSGLLYEYVGDLYFAEDDNGEICGMYILDYLSDENEYDTKYLAVEDEDLCQKIAELFQNIKPEAVH